MSIAQFLYYPQVTVQLCNFFYTLPLPISDCSTSCIRARALSCSLFVVYRIKRRFYLLSQLVSNSSVLTECSYPSLSDYTNDVKNWRLPRPRQPMHSSCHGPRRPVWGCVVHVSERRDGCCWISWNHHMRNYLEAIRFSKMFPILSGTLKSQTLVNLHRWLPDL